MTERLHTFTPTQDYTRYDVTVMRNKWDEDEGKFTVTVYAICRLSAKELAFEKVRDTYPDAVALTATEVGE